MNRRHGGAERRACNGYEKVMIVSISNNVKLENEKRIAENENAKNHRRYGSQMNTEEMGAS